MFDCPFFATTSGVQRTKLSSRTRKIVFLSHKDGLKGFTLFDMNRKNIFVTQGITFMKLLFSIKIKPISIWTHDPFKFMHLFLSIFDNDIVIRTSDIDIL